MVKSKGKRSKARSTKTSRSGAVDVRDDATFVREMRRIGARQTAEILEQIIAERGGMTRTPTRRIRVAG